MGSEHPLLPNNHVHYAGGIIAGQVVLLHLDGWTVDEMAIARSAWAKSPTLG